MEEIKIGQIWYVKLPGSITLATREISDITEKTVALYTARSGIDTRYEISEIKFIERAKN